MEACCVKEVPIIEAANSLGVSIDTVRRRINKGELKARKVPSPHGEIYMVEIPDAVAPVPSDLQDKEENTTEVETLETMRKTISILETELEARRREVQELHVLLQQAQKQLPPGKTEDAAHGTLVKVSWWRRLNPWGKH
jgi:predicted site-specific integrase-resolvase